MLQIVQIINEKIYKPYRLTLTGFEQEPESQKYSACAFKLNKMQVRFRMAYITPKKIGQFVTLWKRDHHGLIKPYDYSDDIDFFIVVVCHNDFIGHFVFPKKILLKKNILSQYKKKGKLAIRVYPPWDKANSPQAKKTQAWQLDYFLDISQRKAIDQNRIMKLYSF